MIPIFVTALCQFGEYACTGERIERDANLERLLLGRHAHDFGHESLQ